MWYFRMPLINISIFYLFNFSVTLKQNYYVPLTAHVTMEGAVFGRPLVVGGARADIGGVGVAVGDLVGAGAL